MTPEDLKERALEFGVAIVQFTTDCRRRPEVRHIADQLHESGTAVSSNYRSACRARSHREFISKLSVALEEADESVGWLETLSRSGLVEFARIAPMLKEAKELVSILGASRRTAEERARERGRRPRDPNDRRS